MKNIILSAICIFLAAQLIGQNEKSRFLNPHTLSELPIVIDGDGSEPHVSAMLDIRSSSKGLLVPRMTSSQRHAIFSPANGLLVFDITLNQFFFYSTDASGAWLPLIFEVDASDHIVDEDGDTRLTVEHMSDDDVVRIFIQDSEMMSVSEDIVKLEGSSDLLIGDAMTGAGDKMFWNASKRAFRFGSATETSWEIGSIGLNSLAFGSSTIASGNYSTAWGSGSRATGVSSTAFGHQSRAEGNQSSAWGLTSFATGDRSTAWGRSTRAEGIGSTTWGQITTAAGENTTAWGHNNQAIGLGTTVWGTLNNAADSYGTSWGESNVNVAFRGTVWGSNNSISGINATAWGDDVTGNGDYSTVWGRGNLVSGDFSTAWGANNSATSEQATTWGGENQAMALGATSWGSFNVSSGVASTTWGDNNNSESFAETTLGRFATQEVTFTVDSWDPSDRLFTIGNGTADGMRSDAFKIYKNGNTTIGGTLDVGDEESMAMLRINGSGGSRLQFTEMGADAASIEYHDLDEKLVINDFVVLNGNGMGIGRDASTYPLEVAGKASKDVPGEWLGHSDMRLKKNIKAISSSDALSQILEMQGVSYEWDDDKTGIVRSEGTKIGFVAQELQKLFPDQVKPDALGYLQAAYGSFDPLMVEAIKALQEQITALEKENEALKRKSEDWEELNNRLTQLENR